MNGVASYEIRPAVAEDREGWLSLWKSYCSFHDIELRDSVTETVWSRIVDPENPTYTLVAVAPNERVMAFMNYIVHPYTLSDQYLCFSSDLYVDSEWRRRGLAGAFIKALIEEGHRKNWLKIYWNTETTNKAALAWHEQIAKQSPYISYDLYLRDN